MNMTFGINQAKSLFFDRPRVMAAVDRATRKNLIKFGSYVRSDAKKSIRKRKKKKPSPAGRPPFSHTGKLKRHIYFMFSMKQRSVIIGPALFSRARHDNLLMLEVGGSRWMRHTDYHGTITKKAANYPARPFMKPALDKNLPSAAALWRDTVHE